LKTTFQKLVFVSEHASAPILTVVYGWFKTLRERTESEQSMTTERAFNLPVCRVLVGATYVHVVDWSATWVVRSDGPSRSRLRPADRTATRRPRRVVSLLGGGSRSETLRPAAGDSLARSLADRSRRSARRRGSIDRDRQRSENGRPFRRLIYAAFETRWPRPCPRLSTIIDTRSCRRAHRPVDELLEWRRQKPASSHSNGGACRGPDGRIAMMEVV